MGRIAAISIAFLLLCGTAGAVTLDRTVSVQGAMETSSGAPANGTFNMELRLFAASTGGTALYSKTVNGVTVTNGVFDVEMGPLPTADLESHPMLWLETIVGGQTLSPRRPLRAQAYSLVAQTALDARGLTCTGCIDADDVAPGAVGPSHLSSGTYSINVSGNASTATTAVSATSLATPLGGDVVGPQTATEVQRLRGVLVAPTGPAGGQVLKYSATNQRWEPGTDAAGNGTVTSVGTGAGLAGGTITTSGSIGLRLKVDGGLVSNLGAGSNELGIKQGGVVPGMVSAGTYAIDISGKAGTADSAASFSGSLSGDVSGTQSATSVIKLRGVPVSNAAPSGGQVLKYDATMQAWKPSADTSGSGTVTSVATGNGLQGGTITTSGKVDLRLLANGGLSATLGSGSNQLGIVSGGIVPSMMSSGTYSISISGNASTASSATTAGTATSFTGSLSGDVTGTQGGTFVAGIRGIDVAATAPSNGQVLKYNSSQNRWEPSADATGSGVTSVNASSPLTSSGGSSPTIGLGTVPTGKGGTGLTSAPSAAGQFLRSTGNGTWGIAGIQAGDLPSNSNSYIRNQTGSVQSGGFRVNGSSVVGSLTFGNGNASPGGASTLQGDQGGSIELGTGANNGNVPYIDFHYGVGSTQDYNLRLINSGNRVLDIAGPGAVTVNVGGTLNASTVTADDATVSGNAYLFGGNGGYQCILSGSCPPGWSSMGLSGVLFNKGHGTCAKMSFPQGSEFNSGWWWCHPYLCCR